MRGAAVWAPHPQAEELHDLPRPAEVRLAAARRGGGRGVLGAEGNDIVIAERTIVRPRVCVCQHRHTSESDRVFWLVPTPPKNKTCDGVFKSARTQSVCVGNRRRRKRLVAQHGTRGAWGRERSG